ADMFNGLMVIPNLLALVGLSKLVAKALNDYDPSFPVKIKK
ncbi:MAG: alanine:cation symporter family protein, partial [Desulfovibrio sp.]|nr:alanine:cation symporter family protein [Desulfovibrio sp.]